MKLNSDGMLTRNSSEHYEFEYSVVTWLNERNFKFAYEPTKLKWHNGPNGPEIIGYRPIEFRLSDLHEAIEFKLQWGDEFISSTGFDPNSSTYYKIVSKDDKSDS